MEAWQNHMPPGMCLKSYGESSNLFDPHSNFTLEDFSREKGLNYHPSRLPVKLETFISYGRAF
jgi:acyl-homoserine lactone acylase PvdQ